MRLGQARMVVTADGAAAVANPDDVMEFWTGFHEQH